MLQPTPTKQQIPLPKHDSICRIKIKHLFLQSKNEHLIMAQYTHSPVQDWIFKKLQDTKDWYMIVNVATQQVISAPHLFQGEMANIKTRSNKSKLNYGFRLVPSQDQDGFHIMSNVEGSSRIWDARYAQVFDGNGILNWHTAHCSWNQTFMIQQIDADHQLSVRDFVRAQRLCAVCLFNEADMINIKCMHAALCEKCSYQVGNKCVICRIQGVPQKMRFC